MLDLSDTDLSETLAPLRIGGNGMVGINVAKRIQPELLSGSKRLYQKEIHEH